MEAVVTLSRLRFAVLSEQDRSGVVVFDSDGNEAVGISDKEIDQAFFLILYLGDGFDGIVDDVSEKTIDITVRDETESGTLGKYLQIDILLIALQLLVD